MKKVTLIVLASFCSFVILVMAGLYFYATTQISPELIRKVTLEQLQKNFPAAKISLGKIDLSFGASIELHLDELDMQFSHKAKKYRLASVKNVSAKIPIWAILIGNGTIQVEVNNPSLGYYELGTENNWTLAMKKSKGKSSAANVRSKVDVEKQEKLQEFSVPGLVSRFRLNVEVKNVDVAYGLKDGSGGDVKFETFLLKNLNFESSTAFELLSKLDITPIKGQTVSLEMLVIGELNLGEFIETQEISCKTMIKARNIKLSNFAGDIPDIKTDIIVKVEKNGNIKGNVQTSFSSRNKIVSKFHVDSKEISLNDINVELYVSDLMEIAGVNNQMIDAGKTKFNVSGKMRMVGKKILPSITFAINPGVSFKYESVVGTSSVKGIFRGKRLSISSNIRVFDGNIDLNLKHDDIDINDNNFDPLKLKPFVIDIGVANLNVTKKQLQELIYTRASKSTSKSGTQGESIKNKSQPKAAESLSSISLPAALMKMKCARNSIGGSDFGCDGKIRVSRKKISIDFLKFHFSEGKGKVVHSSKITSKGIMSTFGFNLASLDMNSLSAFLPPMLDSITGTAKGKVGGSVDYLNNGSLRYDVNVNTSMVDGEVKGMDIAGKVNKVVKSLSKLPKVGKKFKGAKKLQAGDNFERLELVGRFRHSRYDFKKINFIGLHRKILISLSKKGRAYIFPPPLKKDGVIDIDFSENYGLVSTKLNEIAGTKVVPIRVKGEQFSLMPDVGYTLSKLSKKVAKGAIKKEIKKQVKKKAGKKLKKLFKKFKF